MTTRVPRVQRHPSDSKPPPGDMIADRLSSEMLLGDLWLSHIGPHTLIDFIIFPNKTRWAMKDSGGLSGSFLNIYDGPDGSVFYGGHKRELRGSGPVEAEKAMHESIKALPISLKSVIKKRKPKSFGITFAAYWDPTSLEWRDLTGQDHGLRKIMSYPEAKRLYSVPDARMAKRLAYDMENEQAADTFLSILRRIPLTPEMASSIRPKHSSKHVLGPFSWENAKRLAAACGYPIETP